MKICVIGTGYVGLVTGVCLAERNIIDGRNFLDKGKLQNLGFKYMGIGN